MKERSLQDFGLVGAASGRAAALYPFSKEIYERFLSGAAPKLRAWLKANYKPEPDNIAYRDNDSDKTIAAYVHVTDDYVEEDMDIKTVHDDRYALAGWAPELYEGNYELAKDLGLATEQKQKMTYGWGAAAYVFDKYKGVKKPRSAFLKVSPEVDLEGLTRELNATYFVQDLINEPPNVLNCDALTAEAAALAETFGAEINVIKGKALEAQNYPLIYAVGKGSKEEPRLIDMNWGNPAHPTVTLVGKGIVFDTGGPNLKLEQMRTMKYDMAGAAHALGLAYMIMKAKLPIRLRVLLPVAENAIGNHAYRPDEIYTSRKGQTIEIVNTDAEGRLILADTLYEASHPVDPKNKKPELILGFGTTGWHGANEYPGFGSVYSNRRDLRAEFKACARECQEYFVERQLLKAIRKELTSGINTDLLQAIEDHHRYDDLNVFNLLHIQVENEPSEKTREPGFIYTDISPWREPFTAATLYPPDLASGAFAQGMRTSFRLLQKHVEARQRSHTQTQAL